MRFEWLFHEAEPIEERWKTKSLHENHLMIFEQSYDVRESNKQQNTHFRHTATRKTEKK